MGHKHTFRGGTAWAPMRSQRTTDALGNYSSESHKFSQTSNYIPQPNQAKSPRAWSSPEETARRVALLQHPPMCCWRGCRAQLSSCLPRAPSSAEPYSRLVPTLLQAPVPSFPAISSYFSQHEAPEPADMPCPSDRLPSAAPSPGKSGCPQEVVLCRFIKHNHVFK